MGNKQFRCRKIEDDAIIAGDENITQRENMATWHRTDIPLTDVYEIMEILGQGHMGEVYKVRRKVEKRGLHNAETRVKSASNKSIDVPEEVLGMNNNSERSDGSFTSNSKSRMRKQKKNQKVKNEETLKKANAAEEEKKRQEDIATATASVPPVGIPKSPPKSILRNPMEVDLDKIQDLAKLNEEEANNMDNDEDIPPLGLAKTESPQDPVRTFQHRDSSMLHPHFAPLKCCFESSSASETVDNDFSHSEEIIVGGGGGGGDQLGKQNEKKSKWVPRRKIRFQRLYACKTIGTEQIKEKELQELLNEIYMMRKMDHPYIIRLYEVYQVKSKFSSL